MKMSMPGTKRIVKRIKAVVISCVLPASVLLISTNVLAETERYDSPSGLYSFIMPEGYSFYATYDSISEEIFADADGIRNFNIITVEDALINNELLSIVGDMLLDSVIQQYIDAGLSGCDFDREGVFETEENDMTWIGLKVSYDGATSHQCMTCDDDSNMFTITFTGMSPEDEQIVLNSFETNALGEQSSSASQEADNEDISASSENDSVMEYTLMDGKMKVEIPSEYNVLIKDKTLITDEIAASYGLTAEKLETWLSLQGNDLVAVENGGQLDGSSDKIGIRIKMGGYEGVDNFKDYPESFKKLTAEALITNFPETNGYELYETENASFIVFETNMLQGEELRYATVVDENMIYLIYNSASGKLTDEMRKTLRQIASTVQFNG